MATAREAASIEVDIGNKTREAVEHMLAHLRRRRAVLDEDIRGLEDELRMRDLRDNAAPILWDAALDEADGQPWIAGIYEEAVRAVRARGGR